MTNILDISRSGLLAYRTALAVTAENIANVGTEGYRRRDVGTVTAAGAQSTATTLSSGGQGVTVTEVRRAFDDLAAERARNASAGESAATAHLAGARAIETLMIPGDDGIDGTLRAFFDSLSRLAGNPTDSVTRSLTLGSGRAAAESVSELARGMAGLRSDLAREAGGVAADAQALLEDLAQVSRQMSGLAVSGGPTASALHPLADRRDAVLAELAKLLPVSVSLGTDGRPTVRLGGATGPLLLEGTSFARLSVSVPDQLTLKVSTADGQERETRLLASGRIGGLSRALGALDMAAAELDAFSRNLSDALNRVHRGGVDLTGAEGGDLFGTEGWQARQEVANRGTVQVGIVPTATDLPRQAVGLLFDGAAGLWRAFDSAGVELASGADRLVLSGVTVELVGRAWDGDRIALEPVEGRAIDLRLLIGDPARLAAASAFATAASPQNLGSATMRASLTEVPASPIAGLGQVLGTSAVDLPPGVVGMIPAGSGEVTLTSLGRSAATTLAPLAGATRLDLLLDGVADGFDLDVSMDSVALAQALNAGELTSDRGRGLSALGLVARVGQSGELVLTRPGAVTAAEASLSGPGGVVVGATTPPDLAGGTLQVITRNGKHVAGTPLSAAEALALLTPANGFLEGAVYDPAPLTALSGAGYRGSGIDLLAVPGLHEATLASPAPVLGAAPPLAAAAPRSLVLADAAGASVAVELPEGASAALIAARLDRALPGIEARAQTALELRNFAAGAVSFGLSGANGAPVQVSALLSGDHAGPLAQAINALGTATGIRAELSPDGRRLLLVQGEGHDIGLAGLVSPGPGLTATPAGADGLAVGAAVSWTVGGSLRQGGQVTLSAVQGFSLLEGSSVVSSAPEGAAARLETSAAGAVAALRFQAVPLTAEGGLLHRVRVGGRDYDAALPPGASATAVAEALARSLREGAPDAVLTGTPLTALPPDGSAMTFRVDGATYALRMQGGVPVVSGPEAGRIAAGFGADNRLVIGVQGVTDGRGVTATPAAAFGFAGGAGALSITGQPLDPAGLPATVTVRLGGADHALTLGPGSALAVPAGFPGLASVDPSTGALRLEFAAPGDAPLILPSAAAGFGSPGGAVRLEGDRVLLASEAGPVGVDVAVLGSLGQSLTLADLPPEELVVALTGSGTLRLAGALVPGAPPQGPGALTLEIMDAATGRVALSDSLTGHRVTEGTLDASGRVRMGRLAVQLSGNLATGDRFAVLPAGAGSGNAETALALAALRNADPVTGSPGVTERFTRLQGDVGLRAAAAARSQVTAQAAAEAAEREQAAIGAVDLDTEAARLLELQQAYQASAQAAAVARDLFDTLLKLL